MLRTLFRRWAAHVGRTAAQRTGYAAATAIVAYLVAHNGIGASVEIALVLSAAIAVGELVLALTRAVVTLERERDAARRSLVVVNQKIGAHIAVYEWVRNCEVVLKDPSRPRQVHGDWEGAELRQLESNVVASLAYDFYPASFADDVRRLASEPGTSRERVESLLRFLLRTLAEGRYLRG